MVDDTGVECVPLCVEDLAFRKALPLEAGPGLRGSKDRGSLPDVEEARADLVSVRLEPQRRWAEGGDLSWVTSLKEVLCSVELSKN